MNTSLPALRSALFGSTLTAALLVATGVVQPPAATTAAPVLTAEQALILGHMSLVSTNDGFGNRLPTIRITGANVQIVNGLGATNGYPALPGGISPTSSDVNGLGNLIIGYNERGTTSPSPRTGSHNLVLGDLSDYDSFGGIVAGYDNQVLAPYSSALGGEQHRVLSEYSTIAGGYDATVDGAHTFVGGGEGSQATGQYAAVLGGLTNLASGKWASVGAGASNVASGVQSSVSGGVNNTAAASGDWVGGGSGNVAEGNLSSVSGGFVNTASGFWSSVSGGQFHEASGELDWKAGSLFEDE